ncbi:ATP-binding cassette domain-containing protein [Adlercreutzia caecimuris]|uniref:ATP-binding cassette domain-containing protein n=1 Tax=Adlercreutzia caecimuris TaxID=671266 RepID=UPI0024952086|nr:ATP-binding cassette domain-containing protein [Adlercreutzia caecimuris]
MSDEHSVVVDVRNLCKSFGNRKVLDGFSMQVYQGEFVAITGRSGSGKSTLLNIVGLLDAGDVDGSLDLFGAPAPRPGSRGARKLLRRKLAYMFQEPALVEEETAEYNLKIAQYYSDVPRGKRCGEREYALAEVGLEGAKAQRVYSLSGGERQRLALACMRMHPSDLVLADEPTGSLDPANRDAVLEFLRRLSVEGKTVLVVTHDPVVAGCATRVVEL